MNNTEERESLSYWGGIVAYFQNWLIFQSLSRFFSKVYVLLWEDKARNLNGEDLQQPLKGNAFIDDETPRGVYNAETGSINQDTQEPEDLCAASPYCDKGSINMYKWGASVPFDETGLNS